MSPFMAGLDQVQIIAKQEIGFIKGIIRPMWVECNECLNGELAQLIKNVDNNADEWAKKLNPPTKDEK